MSLINISEDIYIDPTRVESVYIDPDATAVDGHPRISITLQHSIVTMPLGNATIQLVVDKINDACAIMAI